MSPIHPAYLAHQRQRFTRPDAYRFLRSDWRRFVQPGSELAAFYESLERKYRPDQARVPAGSREGGQWTDEGGGGGNQNDDRIPRNARPTQYSPDKQGWHQYRSGPNLVCPADLQCSKEEIADQLARYSVPGRDPATPVESGASYVVYIPETGLPVGFVETTVSSDGLTVVNRTLEPHVFYDGLVIRTAEQAKDGSWHVTTDGFGNNVVPGMSNLNEAVGPNIFIGLDIAMRTNIERHHAKGVLHSVGAVARSCLDAGSQFGSRGEAYAN